MFLACCVSLHRASVKMQPLSAVLFLSLVCLSLAWDGETISANGTFSKRRDYCVISVKNGGPWGEWTWVDKCPPETYAIGFSTKVEEYEFGKDNTLLNGLRLFCSVEQTNVMYTVESESGVFGNWSQPKWCPQGGVLISFQLRVQPKQGLGDDTTVNNIQFRCNNSIQLEGEGGIFGEYDEWSSSCKKGGMCGIQTKQEPYLGIWRDDTSLNDIRIFCCE